MTEVTAVAKSKSSLKRYEKPKFNAKIVAKVMRLGRYGEQKFNAMVVAKVMPDNWAQKTVVLHFVEENGVSTVFYATSDAYDEFAALDP